MEVASRSALLADQIEAAIVGGTIRTGSRLGTKEDLRRQYDVAYGTLNEALRILQQRGYVTSRAGPGGGLFASAPNASLQLSQLIQGLHEGGTLGDCTAVRRALEGAVALDAAGALTAVDVRDLEAIVARMAAATEDPRRYMLENWQLHRRIAALCRNRVLGNLYRLLLDANESELRDVISASKLTAIVQHNLDVHRELVAAMAAASKERLRRAIRAHRALTRLRPVDRQLIPARALRAPR